MKCEIDSTEKVRGRKTLAYLLGLVHASNNELGSCGSSVDKMANVTLSRP